MENEKFSRRDFLKLFEAGLVGFGLQGLGGELVQAFPKREGNNEIIEQIKKYEEQLSYVRFPSNHLIFAYGSRDLNYALDEYGKLLSILWSGAIFPHNGNYEDTQRLKKIVHAAYDFNPSFEVSIQLEGYARDASRAEGILKGLNEEKIKIEHVAIFDADEFYVKDDVEKLRRIIEEIGKAGKRPLLDVNPFVKKEKEKYGKIVEIVNSYKGAFSSHSPHYYEFLRERPNGNETYYAEHVKAQKEQDDALRNLGAERYYYTLMFSHTDPNTNASRPINPEKMMLYMKEIKNLAKDKVIQYSFDEPRNGTAIPIYAFFASFCSKF
jgi:hypothetical protein